MGSLKSCPFCGGEAGVALNGTGDVRISYVICTGCGARCGDAIYRDRDPVPSSIAAWNARASTPSASAGEQRHALERIAAFQPKPRGDGQIEREANSAWNRAGEYAAGIARAALTRPAEGEDRE